MPFIVRFKDKEDHLSASTRESPMFSSIFTRKAVYEASIVVQVLH